MGKSVLKTILKKVFFVRLQIFSLGILHFSPQTKLRCGILLINSSGDLFFVQLNKTRTVSILQRFSDTNFLWINSSILTLRSIIELTKAEWPVPALFHASELSAAALSNLSKIYIWLKFFQN
jgi:hypothetical protein